MADAAVSAAYEQHRNIGETGKHHAVMAGAARKMARLDARARHSVGQQRLKARRAPYRRGALHLFAIDCDAASCRDPADLRHDVGHGGIADSIIAGANVERELATARNDVDRAVQNGKLSDRADERRRLAAALFDVEDEFGRSRGRVVASRRSSSLASNRPATALLPRKLDENRTPSSSENAMTSRWNGNLRPSRPRCSASTRAVSTPRRPSYLPALRTVS